MSRWSDEFDKHPIHQLLNQADEYLETEVDETDAAFEDERRRLKNVLGNLREVVAGLDPEFYPKQFLDQIHQHFTPHVLGQLKAYSANPAVAQLRAANDQATAQAANTYYLAAMSRPLEAKDAIQNAQEAFGSFVSSMEATANDTDQRFTKHEAELAAISQKTAALEQTLDALDTSANAKLAEWQDDFTEKQTTRAEEYSTAQIEREKKFATNLKEQQEKFDQERNDTVAKQKALFDSAFEAFKQSAENANKDIHEMQETIRKLHDLVTDETVAGGYHKSAKYEGKAANFWRFASIGCLIITAVWLGIKIKSGFAPIEGGGVNWPHVITASSLTAIFLYAAGYTSRQSKMHRDNEMLLRSYALETQALDPFIASLAPKEQQAIKAELVRRMFGQQNTNGTAEPTTLDDGTVKTLVDKVSDTVSDVVGKVVDKG
ncbi:hypothetical protein K3X41_01905 [Aliiroseovarius crassostreae]|uniref:hypothetical protein n=1 Tax=Aliiroseovarius crassostreae TaxID=154981 RepID=UPI00220B68CF|nr:hypothetical protein [Aliiroseovarius crassostreae]UWQ11479.1 hypothetical protein K3X41_01905 [Aliiroseovarius crassostreae]